MIFGVLVSALVVACSSISNPAPAGGTTVAIFVCSKRCPDTVPAGSAVIGEEKAWVDTWTVLKGASTALAATSTKFIPNIGGLSVATIAQTILADQTLLSIIVITFPLLGLDESIREHMALTLDTRNVQVLVLDPRLVGGTTQAAAGVFATLKGIGSVALTWSDAVVGYTTGLAIATLNSTELDAVRVPSESPLSSAFVAGIQAGYAAFFSSATTNNATGKNATSPAASLLIADVVIASNSPAPSAGDRGNATCLLIRTTNATRAFVSARPNLPQYASAPVISLGLQYGAPDDAAIRSMIAIDISMSIPSLVLTTLLGNGSAASLCLSEASSSLFCALNGTVEGSWDMLMLSSPSAVSSAVAAALMQLGQAEHVQLSPSVTLRNVVPSGAELSDLTNPVAAMSQELNGVFIISHDVSATVLFFDVAVSTMLVVPVEDSLVAIKRYGSIASLQGFLFVFGGQDDTGTLYNHLFVARASTSSLRFSSLDASPGARNPPPRCSASLTAVGADAIMLYGGQCTTRVPCNDLWMYNISTREWSELSLVGGPPTGRYFHSALYFEHDFMLTSSGASDTKWVAFAGGRYTTPIFSLYLYGVTSKTWTAVPAKVPAALLPCLGFANGILVVTTGGLGSVGVNSTFNTYDVHAQRWGTHPVDALVAGPQVCVTIEQSDVGFASLVTRTGGTASALQQLMFTSASCLHLRESNIVLAPDGLSCIACADRTTAKPEGRSCGSCDDAGSQAEDWQVPFCFSTVGRSRAYIGLAIAIVVQMLVVPAIWAVTRVVHASSIAAKNQRAATELSEAVSQMMFERVGYLETVANPTKIERALSSCVRHMRTYHSFFPASIAVIVDKVIAELKANALLTHKASESSDSDDCDDVDALESSKQQRSIASPTRPQQKELSDPQGSATSRVLSALACGLVAREVSVVVTYVAGFHDLVNAPNANPRKTAAKLTRLMDALIQVVRLHNGVPDVVLGDHIYSSWNAFASVENHQAVALRAAYQIAHSPLLASNRIPVRCGFATGQARVGICGTDRFRRHVVSTTANNEAQVYAHECARFDVYIMCEWSPLIRDVLSDVFLFRILGEARVGRNPPNIEVQMTRSNLARWERTLFAELLGPRDLSQWFYELRGHRELVDIYSTIVRAIFMKKVDEARQVAIPREMPKWYEAQLRQALSRGELPTLTVDPFV